MSVEIYGIKNCDTMKKAFKWLDEHNVSYEFHDYKKEGADAHILEKAIEQHGWDTVINRRGTSWRKLDETLKNSMDEATAIEAALENPSLIKRPLLISGDKITLGFKAELYADLF